MQDILHIFENEHSQAVQMYRDFVGKINDFANAYEKLLTTPFDQEVFQKTIQDINAGEPFFVEIFKQDVNDQILKSGLRLPSLITEFERVALADLESLNDVFGEIKKHLNTRAVAGFHIQEVRFNSDTKRAEFTKEDENRVRSRYFTLYANTPELKETVELTQVLIDAHRKLYEKMGAFGLNPTYETHPMLIRGKTPVFGIYGFLTFDNGQQIQPNWQLFFKQRHYSDYQNEVRSQDQETVRTDRIEKARELQATGLSNRQIAKELDVTEGAIRKWFKEPEKGENTQKQEPVLNS